MSASTARGFTVLRRFFNALQRAGLFSARTFAHHRPARFDFHNASGVYADRLDAATCSDRRSRSICFLKFAGNSRSSSNNSRSRSPIFLTIARLCRESMSTEFRITFLPAKTRKHGQFADQKRERPSPWLFVCERLFSLNSFLKAGPKTFGYPRHAPFVDGGRRSRTGKSPARNFVPRFLNICSDFRSSHCVAKTCHRATRHARRLNAYRVP